MQTVETKMKKMLNLPRGHTGIDIVDEAKRMGVFFRGNSREELSEAQGIELLFRGSVLWLRNVLHHNITNMKKTEATKIILFADFLIKLFEDQFRINKINPQ